MCNQLSILDSIESEKRKQQGIEAAISHAEAVEPGWKYKACKAAEMYLNEQLPGFTFMIEDLRFHIEQKGLIESPPSNRSYSAVSTHIKKKGLAKVYGLGKTKSVTTHGAYASVYVKI
jgi:hypothetical protein